MPNSAHAESAVVIGHRHRVNGAAAVHTTSMAVAQTGCEALTTPSAAHAARATAMTTSRTRIGDGGEVRGIPTT